MRKKTQVSFFVMMGIVLVVIVGIFTYVHYKFDTVQPEAPIITSADLSQEGVIRTVESCILESKYLFFEITEKAGELEYSQDPLLYNGVEYNYWCKSAGRDGCRNRIFSRKKLESQLNSRITEVIDNCLNFSIFEHNGFTIQAGETVVDTTIDTLGINVDVNKRLRFQKGTTLFDLSKFTQRFDIAVGRIFDVANMILNEEIEKGYFDKDLWMQQHGAEIDIDRHKPYPDTVYSLRRFDKDTNTVLRLHFAIQGRDTVTDITADYTESPSGWCIEENDCFFNPIDELCEGNIVFDMPEKCTNASAISYPLCSDCADCGIHKHGESWCEYDGAVGNGLDFVGTRHYQRSCINGKIYTEECRDYREEICVSNYTTTGAGSKAICRPNRWKTCMMQNSPVSCEDKTQRDCFWDDTSSYFNKDKYSAGNTRTFCFPQVPPGFKFWSLSGGEVCQMNNEWIDCDGLTCPQSWNEQSLITCHRFGDCGKYYTINGLFGNYSFFTSDLIDNKEGPDLSILPGEELIKPGGYKFNLPPNEYVREDYNPNAFSCDECYISHLAERAEEWTEYVASIEKEDVIADMLDNGRVHFHTRHFTLCLPFFLKEEGDCSECFDPFKPCTKYKCKSLGKNCMFYVDEEGYGRCKQTQESNNRPVILAQTLKGVPYDSFENDLFAADIFGKRLTEEIPPFMSFNISFQTSKPTQCSKSFIPIPKGKFPFDFDFGLSNSEQGFSTHHEFQIYSYPSDYYLLDINRLLELNNFMQLTNIDFFEQKLTEMEENLVEAAEEFDQDPSIIEEKFDELRERYNDKAKPVIESLYNKFNNFIISYLNNINTNKIVTFFNCMDEFGNENDKLFFISYQVKDDHEPPQLRKSAVNNDTAINPVIELEIVLNEPSQCRGSFSDTEFNYMEYEMSCSKVFYTYQDGFRCSIDINKAENSECSPVVYFRCRDKLYLKNITEANINTVSFTKGFEMDC